MCVLASVRSVVSRGCVNISLVKLTYGGVELMNFDIPLDNLATSSPIHFVPRFSSATKGFKDMSQIASQGQTKLQNLRSATVRT